MVLFRKVNPKAVRFWASKAPTQPHRIWAGVADSETQVVGLPLHAEPRLPMNRLSGLRHTVGKLVQAQLVTVLQRFAQFGSPRSLFSTFREQAVGQRNETKVLKDSTDWAQVCTSHPHILRSRRP
jgi:hypothetical protein